MNFLKCIFCTLLLLTSFYSYNQSSNTAYKSIAIATGFNRGIGVSTQFTFHNFALEFPGHLRFGAGLTYLQPGDASDARKLFSSDATDGIGAESGRSTDFRIDYLLPSKILNLEDSYLIFGPRYATFKGNFSFSGSNEAFEITSRQFGIGIGAENYFKIDRNFDFVTTIGLDYYFNSALYGINAFYTPNNKDDNPRNNNENNNPFRYQDANKVIKQPGVMPRIMIGIVYYF